MSNEKFQVTEELAKKVRNVVNKGLVSGLGDPTPGKMCVEAAVCYAMGLDHDDQPPCVDETLRDFKINLNDSLYWLNDKARAKGLVRLAIAQLGTKDNFNVDVFYSKVTEAMKAFVRDSEFFGDHNTSKIKNFDAYRCFMERKLDLVNSICSFEYYNDIDDFISSLNDAIAIGKHSKKLQNQVSTDFCELIVQVLIEMKTPGSKFLYLTE